MVTFANSINSTIGASISGATNTLTIQNPSNTASSQAQCLITVGGTTAGDVWTQYTVGSTTTWAQGISQVASRDFRLTLAAAATGNPSAGTTFMRAQTAGSVNFSNGVVNIVNENGTAAGVPASLLIQNTNAAISSDLLSFSFSFSSKNAFLSASDFSTSQSCA